MALREARRVLTVVRRLADQDSTGPTGVLDQSRARVSVAISSEPERKRSAAVVRAFAMPEFIPESRARRPHHAPVWARCEDGGQASHDDRLARAFLVWAAETKVLAADERR